MPTALHYAIMHADHGSPHIGATFLVTDDQGVVTQRQITKALPELAAGRVILKDGTKLSGAQVAEAFAALAMGWIDDEAAAVARRNATNAEDAKAREDAAKGKTKKGSTP